MKAAETTNKRILVVDDQIAVCNSVKAILSRRGHKVQSAQSTDEALEKIAGARFDLVVSDLMMPDRSGMDLLREVRNNSDTVPFVMITGYASVPSAVEAAKLGVSNYLPKPFTPDELSSVTDKALAEKISFPTFSGKVDEDLPFSQPDFSGVSDQYTERLTRTGIPLLSPKFCNVGKMECGKYERNGACSGVCVILAKRAKRTNSIHLADYVADAIDEDMPFNRSEITASTCPSYLDSLDSSGLPRIGHWQSARIGKSVLVIDGEATISERIRTDLIRSGYAVEQAFNVETARRLMSDKSFDLVIMEQNLPGIDGIALTRELKAARPDIGVVMVSNFVNIESAVEAIQAGALNYTEIPQGADEVLELTDEAIREASSF